MFYSVLLFPVLFPQVPLCVLCPKRQFPLFKLLVSLYYGAVLILSVPSTVLTVLSKSTVSSIKVVANCSNCSHYSSNAYLFPQQLLFGHNNSLSILSIIHKLTTVLNIIAVTIPTHFTQRTHRCASHSVLRSELKQHEQQLHHPA